MTDDANAGRDAGTTRDGEQNYSDDLTEHEVRLLAAYPGKLRDFSGMALATRNEAKLAVGAALVANYRYVTGGGYDAFSEAVVEAAEDSGFYDVEAVRDAAQSFDLPDPEFPPEIDDVEDGSSWPTVWVREQTGRWHLAAELEDCTTGDGGLQAETPCGASLHNAEATSERPDPNGGIAVCPDCAAVESAGEGA